VLRLLSNMPRLRTNELRSLNNVLLWLTEVLPSLLLTNMISLLNFADECALSADECASRANECSLFADECASFPLDCASIAVDRASCAAECALFAVERALFIYIYIYIYTHTHTHLTRGQRLRCSVRVRDVCASLAEICA
jgi:hypothetical protein